MDATELFESNLVLAKKVAYKFAPWWFREEAYSYALEGLWEAAQKYDDSIERPNADFGAYAVMVMKYRIADGARSEDQFTRLGRKNKDYQIPVSLDKEISDNYTLLDALSDKPGLDFTEDITDNAEVAWIVDLLMKNLDPKRRYVLVGVMRNRPFRDIAKDLKLHEARISQMVKEIGKIARELIANPESRPVKCKRSRESISQLLSA